MCRNHSHVAARYLAAVEIDEIPHEVWSCEQQLTIEVTDGRKLILPAGSIFLIPYWRGEVWSLSRPQVTGELYAYLRPSEPVTEYDTDIPESK